jgi:hypothetical protein
MLYQNPAIQSRVEVGLHLVEEAKGGPSKLLLSFLFVIVIIGISENALFCSWRHEISLHCTD